MLSLKTSTPKAGGSEDGACAPLNVTASLRESTMVALLKSTEIKKQSEEKVKKKRR